MNAAARRAYNRRQASAFDKVAHLFEQPVPEEVLGRLRLVVDEASLQPGCAVLDVGTGTGVLLPFILARRPARVVACDLSPGMLRRARRTFGRQVRFLKMDVVDLPPEEGPFDAVFCNACFGNFFDQAQAVQAIARLLNPGGRLVVSHPMGRLFVLQLRQQSDDLELKELPPTPEAAQLLFDAGGLRLVQFRDEPLLYLAIAEKERKRKETRGKRG